MAKEFNSSEYDITNHEEVYNGPHSEIESVSLSKGKHQVPLLRKKHRGYSIEFMSGPNAHTYLQKKGYPVFPTYRYDEENEIEYITDLRRGGTHEIIDFCNHSANPEKIYISNLEGLEKQAEDLVNKLADDGIIINEPNIFFDVEKSTGHAKIIMGDLRELGTDIDDETIYTKEMIFQNDKWIIDEHMNRLKAIALDKPE